MIDEDRLLRVEIEFDGALDREQRLLFVRLLADELLHGAQTAVVGRNAWGMGQSFVRRVAGEGHSVDVETARPPD